MPGGLGCGLESLLLCPQALLSRGGDWLGINSPCDCGSQDRAHTVKLWRALVCWPLNAVLMVMPAAPVEAASVPSGATVGATDGVDAIDALLDAITGLKAQQKQLEQQLEPLLESLSEAMASGQLDPSFSHDNWAFAHSSGRLSYEFPPAVQQIEQQLKAAKEAAIQQGSATEKRGKPFWTIRPPKAQDQPF